MAAPTPEEKLIESLKQLQDWSKWMVTVQTAVLGVIALATFKGGWLLGTTIFFVVGTILLAAWVLSSIPSVTRRVSSSIRYEEYVLYDYPWLKKLGLTLDHVAMTQHVFFAISIILLGILVYGGV